MGGAYLGVLLAVRLQQSLGLLQVPLTGSWSDRGRGSVSTNLLAARVSGGVLTQDQRHVGVVEEQRERADDGPQTLAGGSFSQLGQAEALQTVTARLAR